MKKHYKLSIFIGRFSPLHNGHLETIRKALDFSDKLLILIGSSDEPSTPRNPWSFTERSNVIFDTLRDFNLHTRVIIKPLVNSLYNDQKWAADVQFQVKDMQPDHEICLVGLQKDESTYYLKSFPQWAYVETDHDKTNLTITATSIRNSYFNNDFIMKFHIPNAVHIFLDGFKSNIKYLKLKKEFEFLTHYKNTWKPAPHTPTFNTTDAVVIQSGHILLIRRKNVPGKGLWALPGGYLGIDETLEDSMIRELREETRIKIPTKVLKGSIKKIETFDDPHRSQRGRIITTVFYIQLSDVQQTGNNFVDLPKICGNDDADKAQWFGLNYFLSMRESLFSDHYHIVRKILGI